MSEWSKQPEELHSNDKLPKVPPATSAAVLPALQNWHVLDEQAALAIEDDEATIDGSATLVLPTTSAICEDPTGDGHTALPTDELTVDIGDETTETREEDHSPLTRIPDQLDPAIVVTVAERAQQVSPGDEVEYSLSILNNGNEAATYQVLVEGWIIEEWLPHSVTHLTLGAGERRTVAVTVAPPLRADSTVGERALAFVVRNSERSSEVTRVGATLTILPYPDLRLAPLRPKEIALTWWQRRAAIAIPLSNGGNYPVKIRLHARQTESFCSYRFTTSRQGSQSQQASPSRRASQAHEVSQIDGSSTADRGPKAELVQLAPGESCTATMNLWARSHPWLGLRKKVHALQVVATAVEDPEQPYHPWSRTAPVTVSAAPLLGPWQLTSLIGLVAIALTGLGMVGLIGLLLFSLSMRPAQEAAPVSPPAIASQPIIVAYIQAPVPQNASVVQGQEAAIGNERLAPIVVDPAAVQRTQPGIPAALPAPANEAAPILSVDQVSAPVVTQPQNSDASNSVVVAPASSLPLVEISAPATPAPMTYATMFHEIGYRYKVDWRMLAAQAYVESGFDSLALGAQGDLGLMQIHPATWREWAPTVDADDPFDSYNNALVAAAYLDYLHTTLSKRGHPEIEWTLVAYNWGIDKVLQHLESGQSWQELSSNRQAYALEVLRLAESIP